MSRAQIAVLQREADEVTRANLAHSEDEWAREVARLDAERDVARLARARAVAAAVADGWSLAEIAREIGVSRQRIGQLAAEGAS